VNTIYIYKLQINDENEENIRKCFFYTHLISCFNIMIKYLKKKTNINKCKI